MVPSTRSLTFTIVAISGVKPTAPFQLKSAVAAGTAVPGEAPLIAPSEVAGSPRINGFLQLVSLVQPGHGVLKIYGNWEEGWPAATSAKPESGPKENMNVCVPSASVM
jgi:hypothetical protein